MKFKYMLRGFGIGVVVTAAIMGAYSRTQVADARVAVIKEYGFGEEPTLVDTEDFVEAQQTIEPQTQETQAEESQVEETQTKETQTEETQVEETKTEETKTEEIRTEETETEKTEIEETEIEETETEEIRTEETETEEIKTEEIQTEETQIEKTQAEGEELVTYIELTIVSGDSSEEVSKKLYEAGIIDDAAGFNSYMAQNGYDKKIRTGTKTIYSNYSWQEIAFKLVNKE